MLISSAASLRNRVPAEKMSYESYYGHDMVMVVMVVMVVNGGHDMVMVVMVVMVVMTVMVAKQY